jgi:two-component system phosphate regulon sensor histidine kinase PhoR
MLGAPARAALLIGFALLGILVAGTYGLGAALLAVGGLVSVAALLVPARPITHSSQAESNSATSAGRSPAGLLDAFAHPVLIVVHNRIEEANAAAISLLGRHILGQDARTALRAPAAVEQLSDSADHEIGTTVSLGGRSVVWAIRTTTLPSGRRVVQLIDRSGEHSLERAKVDFVANASHELRTPLAAVLGFVETLTDGPAGDDPATRGRFLKVIDAEARRMQAVVEDLISLSRIESNVHERPKESVDIGAVVRQAVEEIRDPTGNRRKNIHLSLGDSPPSIPGDQVQLLQVARNLIDNAVKYGRPDGQIRVSIERAPGEYLAIRIADEGEGIAPEHLPRLTERFYRVDTGRSRAGGGTGLGLAIVKHIVERHRGRLSIRSELGVGTTVTVELPLGERPPL